MSTIRTILKRPLSLLFRGADSRGRANAVHARPRSALALALAIGGIALLALGARPAQAQEIEPNEFVAQPAGTNIFLGYYVYGHNTEYSIAGGPTLKKNTGLEVNLGVARYVHFTRIGDYPAGFQIYEIFGSESGGQIGGQRLGSAFGAQNTIFSAFFFPIADPVSKTYLVTSAFLYPPDGTYDKTSPINIGDNRWRGDVQIGIDKGIGDHFSTDISFDVMFYGDNTAYYPGFTTLSQNPTYRVQVWANWNWTRAFQTSIGYSGYFGGRQQVNGIFMGNETHEQRIRAAASLFLSPRLQTLVEVNHDVSVSGGFRQQFGATLRVVYVF